MSMLTSTPAGAGYTWSQYNYLNGTYFPTPFHLQQQQQQQQAYIGPAAAPSLVSPPVYSAPVDVSGVCSLPQYQQAQQLFQKVAQTITPEAIQNVKAALASSEIEQKAEAKRKAVPRKAAGQTWEDPTLADWPENDFRLFCGNLGNEVNDDVLMKAFSRFPSFNMARVVRDKRTGKTKGYGFVSFSNPSDLVVALKEMNGKYVGNRPVQLRKSKWKDRIDYEALIKQKGQLMQMTVMTPPSLNKELHYLNKEDRLLRWLLVKHRDIKFGFDFLSEDDTKAELSKFRSNLYDDEEEDDDDDDDDDEAERHKV